MAHNQWLYCMKKKVSSGSEREDRRPCDEGVSYRQTRILKLNQSSSIIKNCWKYRVVGHKLSLYRRWLCGLTGGCTMKKKEVAVNVRIEDHVTKR